MSIGLLVGMIVWLPGTPRSPLGAAAAVVRPASYLLDGQGTVRAQGRLAASLAEPVGYAAQVADQPDAARYVGLIERDDATSLRDDVSWAFVEPAQGRFDWSVPDEIVAQSAQHHLHALLVIDTSPRWASGGSAANTQWPWLPPRSPVAYGVFAATVTARYSPSGVFWRKHPGLPRYLPAGLELWNEENLGLFWGGQTPNPRVYTAMVTAAYSRIKRADPAMTVVLGGLAPGGAYDDITCSGQRGTGHDAAAWNGLNYLQALYADGIHGHFDAVGWHPYHYWKGATAEGMLAYDRCSAWSQMAGTPVSVRSLMAAHGDAARRIWITETGAPTCTANAAYTCVSPAQQAALAASETRIWRALSWAGGFYWYDIRDDTNGTQHAQAHFGTLTSGDTPKPAYRTLQQAWRQAPQQKGPLTLPVPGSRGVRSVAFSPDGKFLAAGDGNGHVYVWQLGTRRLAGSMADPRSKGVSSVTFNPVGSLLAAADANGHVYLWAANKLLATLAAPSGKGVRSVVFSPDGTFLAAGDTDGHVDVWRVGTRRLTSSMADPRSKGVSSVAFNPAGSLLAVGDANGHIYLWGHRLAGTLADPSSHGVTSVAFSSDSKYLVVGDADGKAYTWLVSKGVIVQLLADPSSKGVNWVAFNPGNTLLAAGDGNGRVFLWTHTLTGTLTDPRSRGVRSVAFSLDGKYVAAADANGHVYLWLLTS
jgi:WD40 repeat protein